MALVADLNQLRSYSNFVGVASNAAFKNIIDTQLATDPTYIFISTFVGHRRCTRDDSQILGMQTPELRYRLFRQSVAEIILLRIGAEIVKRQNNQHRFSVRSNLF